MFLGTSATNTNCTYAPRSHIEQLFHELANGGYSTFFANVVDDVDWNVQGTHPLAGMYSNKTVFVVNTVARLGKIENATAPHSMKILNIVGGCDEEWSAQEIWAKDVMNNGMSTDAAMIKLTSSQDFISITTSYGSRDGTRRAR